MLAPPAACTSSAKRSQPYASSSDAYVIGTSGVVGDELVRLREHVEACPRPHPPRERPLGGAADDRTVGERVGEREAELDMSAPPSTAARASSGVSGSAIR